MYRVMVGSPDIKAYGIGAACAGQSMPQTHERGCSVHSCTTNDGAAVLSRFCYVRRSFVVLWDAKRLADVNGIWHAHSIVGCHGGY